MARQRVPLNLYLLKPGVAPADVVGLASTVVDGADAPDDVIGSKGGWVDTWVLGEEPYRAPLPETRDTAPALLVRGTPATSGWQVLVQSVVPDAPLGGSGENYGALLFQSIGADVVVWSFG